MIYVVIEGNRVIECPEAVSAKPAGGAGLVIHLFSDQGEIAGNFPMKIVRFYGSALPPFYSALFEEQKRWASLTQAEKDAEIEAARKRREEREGRA